MQTVQTLLFERFDRRLADFLLSECEKNDTRELHMTHEEIARQLSSAREVVARTLKRFSDSGAVELPARRRAGLPIWTGCAGCKNRKNFFFNVT